MNCPNCHGKGYVEVSFATAVPGASFSTVNVECDHMVADPNCPDCGGKGAIDSGFGFKIECGCKRRFDAGPLPV